MRIIASACGSICVVDMHIIRIDINPGLTIVGLHHAVAVSKGRAFAQRAYPCYTNSASIDDRPSEQLSDVTWTVVEVCVPLSPELLEPGYGRLQS